MSKLPPLSDRAVCHQYEIRESHREKADNRPPFLMSDLKQAVIRKVDFQTAKPIIVDHEWLGRMSATSWHYALYPDADTDLIAGVACIGGVNCTGGSYLHVTYGLTPQEIGVFARGTCVWWAHEHSASFLIANALKLLKKDAPHKKIILAYSDPSAGEIGTVYQATNWYYLGRTKTTSYRYRSPDGTREFSDASIIVQAQKRGVTWKQVKQEYLDGGWVMVAQAKKHRYAFLQDKSDKRLKALLESMSMPYPKRGQ